MGIEALDLSEATTRWSDREYQFKPSWLTRYLTEADFPSGVLQPKARIVFTLGGEVPSELLQQILLALESGVWLVQGEAKRLVVEIEVITSYLPKSWPQSWCPTVDWAKRSVPTIPTPSEAATTGAAAGAAAGTVAATASLSPISVPMENARALIRAGGVSTLQKLIQGKKYGTTKASIFSCITSGTNGYAEGFDALRLYEVGKAFCRHRIVTILGDTGVGKTHFCHHTLKTLSDNSGIHPAQVFTGMEAVQAWLESKDRGPQILWLDEANLYEGEWRRLLEGISREPATVFWRGEWYVLGPQHRVLLTGNPASYGGERQRSRFMEEGHGAAGVVTFERLMPEQLYAHTILPLLEKQRARCVGRLAAINRVLPAEAAAAGAEPSDFPVKRLFQLVSQIILAFDTLVEKKFPETKLTPRELQMMVLMSVETLMREARKPGESMDIWVCEGTKRACLAVVLQTQREGEARDSLRATCERMELCPCTSQEMSSSEERDLVEEGEFVFCEEHRGICSSLEKQLAIHHWRNSLRGEERIEGGLGLYGFVLTGAPGLGKTTLVRGYLKNQGYQELSAALVMSEIELRQRGGMSLRIPARGYMVLPMEASIGDKERYLRAAFKLGLVIVMDEMNASPLELVLNDLLGQVGASSGREKVGFIIGTENDVDFGGRLARSQAGERRVYRESFPKEFSDKSLLRMFCHRYPGLSEEIPAKALRYFKQRKSEESSYTLREWLEHPMGQEDADASEIARAGEEKKARQLAAETRDRPTRSAAGAAGGFWSGPTAPIGSGAGGATPEPPSRRARK